MLADTPHEPGSYVLTIGLARADRPLAEPGLSSVRTTVRVVEPPARAVIAVAPPR